MDKKKYKYHTLIMLLVLILSVTVAAVLAIFSPYMKDDWAWGTSVGAMRFNTFFSDYNGRYLGNLFIYALTRSKALWIVSLPVAVVVFALSIRKITANNRVSVYLAAASMIFLMRAPMFRQVIVWRSGFSNYVPPVLFLIVYLAVISDITGNNAPEYSKNMPFITFFVGIVGALFMEHVTILSIAVAVAVIIYAHIRFKKVYAAHIGYLAGTTCGAVIMFSNSAYMHILSGNDTNKYRSVAGNTLGNTILSNLFKIAKSFIEYNVGIVIVTTLLFCAITFVMIRNKKLSKKAMAGSIIVLSYQVVYCAFISVLLLGENSVKIPRSLDLMRILLAVLCFGGYVALTFILPFGRQIKTKLAFFVLLSGALTVPLLVVNPVNERCIFPSHIMMSVFACILFSVLLKSIGKNSGRIWCALVLILFGTCAVYYCSVYADAYQYTRDRNNYIAKQVESGSEEIDVPLYPKKMHRFVAGSDFYDNELWKGRFCEFYDIDKPSNDVRQEPAYRHIMR